MLTIVYILTITIIIAIAEIQKKNNNKKIIKSI